MKFRAFLQALACAASALAATSVCAGERWRFVESPQQQAVDATSFMLGADGALWTFGADGVRRFDAAGTATGAIPTIPGTRVYSESRPLADNGAILQMYVNGDGCVIERVDEALNTRWSRLETCGVFEATPGGMIWLATYNGELRRLGQDGTVAAVSRYSLTLPQLAAMPDGGVAVATSSVNPPGGRLARHGIDGAERWSFQRDRTGFTQVASRADGSVAAAGVVFTDGSPGDIVFNRFDANGTLLSEYRSQGVKEVPMVLKLADDGSASVLSLRHEGGTVRYALHRFGPDGRLAWRTEACNDTVGVIDLSFALLPGGEVSMACPEAGGARLLRFAATGAQVASAVLPTAVASLALRADGNLQVLGRGQGAGLQQLYVRDVHGNPVDVPTPQGSEALQLVDRWLGADGTSLLLSVSSRSAGPRLAYLSKVDASGALAWRRTFPAIAPVTRLSVAGGQACVTTSPRWTLPWPGIPQYPGPVSITCLAATDGSDRWTRSFPTDGNVHHFGALDDGTFIYVRGDYAARTHTFVRYDASGNEIVRVEGAGFAPSASIGASARAAVVEAWVMGGTSRLVRYDAQGNAREIDSEAVDGFDPVETTDDAALVWARVQVFGQQVAELRSYANDGRVVWKYALPDGAVAASFTRAGDAIYLGHLVATLPVGAVGTRITRLDARNGTAMWQQTSKNLTQETDGIPVAVGVSGDSVALMRSSRERVRLLYLDAYDGAERGEQSVACNRQCGHAEYEAVALDTDGNARVVVPVASPVQGASAAVIAVGNTLMQTAVRLDQPGLTGAWWASYASGEGFVVDWLPASRTWFMPWFTFSREGGADVAGQRRYSIAGSVPDGARQIQLPILYPTGGRFDAAGVVTTQQVGVATLRFTDCDNGTLRYAFNADQNGAAAGEITLSRLLPATQDCVLADGTVQSRTVPPANGFDARMSGSWFEEATAGQGLQFTVQPNGIFFAPWFTFDPANTTEPRDPGRQRWFALQGSLATAVAGRVELPITRATGGAFDSGPATNMPVVGTATLTMLACDKATLEYAFDATEVAGDMRGAAGTIALAKAGGCAP